MSLRKRIVIVGGGLAGTSAAHTLVKHGHNVTIVEKNNYLGGRIHSHLVDNAAVEMGAGFMTNAYSNLLAFLASSNLKERLYRQYGSSGIFRNGSVRMITPGNLIGNDTLSWRAKFHALPLGLKTFRSWPDLDLHALWKAAKYDERSVTDMFNSPGGKEFLEYVLQPILNGYLYWTPEDTSEAMMLILCRAALSHGTYKVRGGLQRIPEKASESSTVLLNHTVTEVCRNKNGTYTIDVECAGKRRILQADGVVCATTASVVTGIFPHLSQQQRAFFESVNYSSTALIARTYKQEHTKGDKGIAFPRKEGINLAAVTISPEPEASPRPGASGPGLATLKTYASGAVGNELCTKSKSDAAIIQTLGGAMEPVREAMLIGNPQPLAVHIQRWPEALPMFDVGHFKRLLAFEEGTIEDQNQAVVFAGDYIGGPFMEGAFTSGVRAAERLNSVLSTL